MEHYTSMAGSRSSPLSSVAPAPAMRKGTLSSPSAHELDQTSLQDEEQPPPSSLPFPSFASLSLTLAPVIPPSICPTPKPNAGFTSKSSASSAPALKKAIKLSPLMPAISAAALLAEKAFSIPFSKTRKSSTAFPDYQRLPDSSKNFGDPSNGGAVRRASVVWFRNDLRCHDNEALAAATEHSVAVLPVYCFDPRDYGKSSSGFDKTGPYRAKFLLECVSTLREKLRERGSDLVIRVGKPEEVLVDLARSVGADALYAHQEVSCEEVVSEKKVSAALQEEGVDVEYFWGSTLFHVDDLPFKLDEMPITYSGFREKVQDIKVRQAGEAPKQLKGLPVRGSVKPGDIPTLQELGLRPLSTQHQDEPTVTGSALIGGEVEALTRLKNFAEHYRQCAIENGSRPWGDSIYGSNFSCKISPWLAMGCLSPRRMFEDLRSSEKRSVTPAAAATGSILKDKGLNWLVFELLWRDFFRFITKKYAESKSAMPA